MNKCMRFPRRDESTFFHTKCCVSSTKSWKWYEKFHHHRKHAYRVPRRLAPSRRRSHFFWAILRSWFASGSLKFVVFSVSKFCFCFPYASTKRWKNKYFSPFSRRFATQGQILIFYTHRVSSVKSIQNCHFCILLARKSINNCKFSHLFIDKTYNYSYFRLSLRRPKLS